MTRLNRSAHKISLLFLNQVHGKFIHSQCQQGRGKNERRRRQGREKSQRRRDDCCVSGAQSVAWNILHSQQSSRIRSLETPPAKEVGNFRSFNALRKSKILKKDYWRWKFSSYSTFPDYFPSPRTSSSYSHTNSSTHRQEPPPSNCQLTSFITTSLIFFTHVPSSLATRQIENV